MSQPTANAVEDSVEKEYRFARVVFGMSREEFLAQTPREWADLCETFFAVERVRQEADDRRTARICMVLSWCHGNPDAKEEDFIPAPAEESEQTSEQMIAVMMGLDARRKRS